MFNKYGRVRGSRLPLTQSVVLNCGGALSRKGRGHINKRRGSRPCRVTVSDALELTNPTYEPLTHLLTHMTRTTDAFAASTPARPGAGVTYCASRKRRMVSTGTTLAGGSGPLPTISGA